MLKMDYWLHYAKRQLWQRVGESIFAKKNENWLLCKEAAGRWRVYFLLFFSFCTVISKQVAVTAVRSELFFG